MATLRIVVDGAEQKFPLEAASVTLGRGLESDIRLKDIKASRRHCQIVKTAKGYQCVDLSSGNGTYVNGVQIKQQALGPGDRITIGSTTVTFEDAAPPPKPAPAPRGPTEKLPLVRPPSSRAGVASEKVPVAPTRKITSRVDAAKSSQGALKPVSQPLAKTASRVGKPVDAAASRPLRASGPRTARPQPEPGKKKTPLLLAAAGGGVLLLAVGGYLLFSSHDGGDQVKAQIEQFVKRAEKAERADRVDEAIQDYRKALDLCEGDRYKMRRSEINKLLQSLESRRGTGSAGASKNDPKEPPDRGPDFQAKKSEIAEKHKLAADPAGADWNGALKDWSDFQKGKVPDDTKAKVAVEMAAVQAKAKEDADRLRKKAEALAQENKMAEAVDLLRQQLPRFSHPALKPLADDLQSTLKKYDK